MAGKFCCHEVARSCEPIDWRDVQPGRPARYGFARLGVRRAEAVVEILCVTGADVGQPKPFVRRRVDWIARQQRKGFGGRQRQQGRRKRGEIAGDVRVHGRARDASACGASRGMGKLTAGFKNDARRDAGPISGR